MSAPFIMRQIVLLLALVAAALGQTAPSISNVTNAAIPALDFPPNSVALAPGSMAIIFGTKLADYVSSAPPPWQKALSGVEVRLVEDSCYDPSCELVADLIYASPTQINFVVPNVPLYGTPNAHVWNTRVVLVKNGERFDDRTRILGGPGRVYIDAVYGYADSAVFGVGYDCLYSFSLSDPGACGLSWSQGPHRAMLGAVTDAISGQLITAQNPVHQGQLLTLWMTGLTGNPWFNSSASFCFGVAQNGKDLPSGDGWCQSSNSPTMPGMWAGKSPEYPGLDQANVTFPVCATSSKASAEKRYDVWVEFSGNTKVSQFSDGTIVRVYLPLVVNQGDSDCNWSAKGTTTTLQASPNPSRFGQAVTFKATISPSAATGTVAFLDGGTSIGSGTVSSGTATFITSTLSVGDHSIVATYNGDGHYASSSTTPQAQTVKSSSSTTTTVTSSSNPAISGQSLTFTATVSPSDATGTVTFFNGTNTLGTVVVNSGKATCGTNSSCATSALGAGSFTINATYSGDSRYGTSSGTLTQIVTVNTTTVLTASASLAMFGQSVTFTATVSPCCIPTGTVTFMDGNTTLGTGKLSPQSGINKATFVTSSLSVGTHSITARYSGDGNSNGNTSGAVALTVWTISLTSNPNPSSAGQTVTFTACGIPNGASGTLAFIDGATTLGTNNNVASPCSPYSTNILSVGTHTIIARYSDVNGAASVFISQTVVDVARINSTITLKAISSSGRVNLTAVVSPVAATGTVQFLDNANIVGSANVTSQPSCTSGTGQCVGIVVSLSSGSHSITATYSGNSSYMGGTSSPITMSGTSTTITASPNPSTSGQQITFTATVSATNATGSVSFGEGIWYPTGKSGQDVAPDPVPIECFGGVSPLNNGQVKCTTLLLSGTHSISAVYSGDSGYGGSGSTVTQTVR